MGSRHHTFYGWIFIAMTVVAMLTGVPDAVQAGLFVTAVVLFATADILRALGK